MPKVLRQKKIRISYYDENGKRKFKRFHSKTEANRWKLNRLDEVEKRKSGAIVIQEKIFSEFIKTWFQTRTQRVEAGTYLEDDSRLKRYILPVLGSKNLHEIRRSEIKVLLENIMRENNLSPVTGNRILSLLSAIFKDALELELTESNPVSGIKRFRESGPDKWDYWAKREEIEAYLKASDEIDSRYGLIAQIALNTGLRLGEILALKVKHFLFDANALEIRSTYETSRKRIKEKTKGGKRRVVSVQRGLSEVLKEWVRGKTPDTLFFPSPEDPLKPFHPRRIGEFHERACKKAGVRRIRFHDLRHTFASHYVMNNGSMRTLQEILGHSTIRMTERYAHLSTHERGERHHPIFEFGARMVPRDLANEQEPSSRAALRLVSNNDFQ